MRLQQTLVIWLAFPCAVVFNNLLAALAQAIAYGHVNLWLVGQYCETTPNGTWLNGTNGLFASIAILHLVAFWALARVFKHARPTAWARHVGLLCQSMAWVGVLALVFFLMHAWFGVPFISYFFSHAYLFPLYLPLGLKVLYTMLYLIVLFALLGPWRNMGVPLLQVQYILAPMVWACVLWAIH